MPNARKNAETFHEVTLMQRRKGEKIECRLLCSTQMKRKRMMELKEKERREIKRNEEE